MYFSNFSFLLLFLCVPTETIYGIFLCKNDSSYWKDLKNENLKHCHWYDLQKKVILMFLFSNFKFSFFFNTIVVFGHLFIAKKNYFSVIGNLKFTDWQLNDFFSVFISEFRTLVWDGVFALHHLTLNCSFCIFFVHLQLRPTSFVELWNVPARLPPKNQSTSDFSFK